MDSLMQWLLAGGALVCLLLGWRWGYGVGHGAGRSYQNAEDMVGFWEYRLGEASPTHRSGIRSEILHEAQVWVNTLEGTGYVMPGFGEARRNFRPPGSKDRPSLIYRRFIAKLEGEGER